MKTLKEDTIAITIKFPRTIHRALSIAKLDRKIKSLNDAIIRSIERSIEKNEL